MKADQRDATPDPPAELSPYAVLFLRACTRRLLDTGEVCFPRGVDWVGAGPEPENPGDPLVDTRSK